jgi:hypothetical protein
MQLPLILLNSGFAEYLTRSKWHVRSVQGMPKWRHAGFRPIWRWQTHRPAHGPLYGDRFRYYVCLRRNGLELQASSGSLIGAVHGELGQPSPR